MDNPGWIGVAMACIAMVGTIASGYLSYKANNSKQVNEIERKCDRQEAKSETQEAKIADLTRKLADCEDARAIAGMAETRSLRAKAQVAAVTDQVQEIAATVETLKTNGNGH